MCGILISSLEIKKEAHKNTKNRGPDGANLFSYKGYNFVHFLLSLTGEKTLQPIMEDDILCMFNGEIYNYKEIDESSKSDGHSIISSYKKYDEDFVKYLDGEFVIVLFDFNKNRLIISSDIFKTKPLFYSIAEDIVIASYVSSCKQIKDTKYKSINHNETLIYNLNTKKLIKKMPVYNFDLEQKKDNYDDYINAFERAILKRYPEKSIPLVQLSSGVDSGAIACCLFKHNKKALYYTIPGHENMHIIQQRQNILGDSHKIIDLKPQEKLRWRKGLEENCEKFNWDWTYHPRLNNIDNGFNMGSMLGKSKIIDLSKKYDNSIRVLYSGIGADDIMSFNTFDSCGYGGVGDFFPEDLSSVYPWPNFYNGTMERYLKGDEYVGGCWGYETRYPYCDKDLVQEFLWLKPNLKNSYKGSCYKPALLYYLVKEHFPFHTRKIGFDC